MTWADVQALRKSDVSGGYRPRFCKMFLPMILTTSELRTQIQLGLSMKASRQDAGFHGGRKAEGLAACPRADKQPESAGTSLILSETAETSPQTMRSSNIVREVCKTHHIFQTFQGSFGGLATMVLKHGRLAIQPAR